MQDDIPGGITRYDKTHGRQRLYTRKYVDCTAYSRGKMASQVEGDRIGGVSIGARFETRSWRRYNRMYGTRGTINTTRCRLINTVADTKNRQWPTQRCEPVNQILFSASGHAATAVQIDRICQTSQRKKRFHLCSHPWKTKIVRGCLSVRTFNHFLRPFSTPRYTRRYITGFPRGQ